MAVGRRRQVVEFYLAPLIGQAPRQVEFLASRWAVKEACHKALGNWRLPFPEIVLRNGSREHSSNRVAGDLYGDERRRKSRGVVSTADAVHHTLEQSLTQKMLTHRTFVLRVVLSES